MQFVCHVLITALVPVWAAGPMVHMEAAKRAKQVMQLPPEVEAAINNHPDALRAGAPFVDFLYLCGGQQGSEGAEMAHWRPYHQVFASYIREKHPNWANGDEHGAALVAFLMGVASHYIADVNWHGIGPFFENSGLIPETGAMDLKCNGGMCNDATSWIDTGAETILQMMDPSVAAGPWWLPAEDLVAIFAKAGLIIEKKWICQCEQVFRGMVKGLDVASFAWPEVVRKAPSVQVILEDFFLGGVDDLSMWSSLAWKETADMLHGGASPTLDMAAYQKHVLQSKRKNSSARADIFSEVDAALLQTEGPFCGPRDWIGFSESSASESSASSRNPDDDYSYRGSSVALCDLDNDGSEDLIVGTPGKRGKGRPLNGEITVYYEGLGGRRYETLAGTKILSRFGSTLHCADLDADGYPELLVAAPTEGKWELTERPGQNWWFENQSYTGAVHAFNWNGSSLLKKWTWQNDRWLGNCGKSLVTLGSQIFVGCPFTKKGTDIHIRHDMSVGRVVALSSRGSLLWETWGDHIGQRLGFSLAAIPKLRLVAAGAPGHRLANTATTVGAVMLLDSDSGAEVARWESHGDRSYGGYAVASDGHDTLWVGAPGADKPHSNTVINRDGGPVSGRVDRLEVARGSDNTVSVAHKATLHTTLKCSSFNPRTCAMLGESNALNQFGLALAYVPDVGVAVSAPLANVEQGTVEIFTQDANHLYWSGEHLKFMQSRFGMSVAASRAKAFVGTPKLSNPGIRNGAVSEFNLPVQLNGEFGAYCIPFCANVPKRASCMNYCSANFAQVRSVTQQYCRAKEVCASEETSLLQHRTSKSLDRDCRDPADYCSHFCTILDAGSEQRRCEDECTRHWRQGRGELLRNVCKAQQEPSPASLLQAAIHKRFEGPAVWSLERGSSLELQQDCCRTAYLDAFRLRKLCFQHDGNLVLYEQKGVLECGDIGAAWVCQPSWKFYLVWATNSDNSGASLEFQGDGNVVIYNDNHEAQWDTGTASSDAQTLQFQNDGNLVVYTTDRKAVWSASDHEIFEKDWKGTKTGWPGANLPYSAWTQECHL